MIKDKFQEILDWAPQEINRRDDPVERFLLYTLVRALGDCMVFAEKEKKRVVKHARTAYCRHCDKVYVPTPGCAHFCDGIGGDGKPTPTVGQILDKVLNEDDGA